MTSKVVYEGALRTTNTHTKSGASYQTDAPVDNHGKGEAFSPTDTIATGLANCMLTVMGIKADQLDVDLTGTIAEVTKKMADHPRRISQITVVIHFKKSFDAKTTKILEHTAATCPVAQSLHPDIIQTINFQYPSAG